MYPPPFMTNKPPIHHQHPLPKKKRTPPPHHRLMANSIKHKGGGLFEFQTPPTPPDPPKFSNLSFCNLRFWGKGFFFPPPDGGVFFLPYVSILEILRILWRIQKCLKDAANLLTPRLTSGSDLG